MAFEDDVGIALAKACEQDNTKDVMHIARATQIVRRHIFGEAKSFNGFPERCQEDSVPQLLLTLVHMLLEGPSIKNQMAETTSPTALAIAQIIKFNSVKHKRGPGTGFVRHSTTQEIPVPLYVGLMLHAHTQKKELTSTVNSDGEQHLQASSKVVCPPQLHSQVFIDHIPSSTTARDLFHGTAISLH